MGIALVLSGWVYVQSSRPLFTTVVLSRFLMVAAMSEILRATSFLFTILPSPSEHCLPGSTTYNPPENGELLQCIEVLLVCKCLCFY